MVTKEEKDLIIEELKDCACTRNNESTLYVQLNEAIDIVNSIPVENLVRQGDYQPVFACGHCVDCKYLEAFGAGTNLHYCKHPKIQESEMFEDETGTHAIYDINDFGCIKFER